MTIDANGRVTDAKGCTITDVNAVGGRLAFDRLDDCLPFPIADNARAARRRPPRVAPAQI